MKLLENKKTSSQLSDSTDNQPDHIPEGSEASYRLSEWLGAFFFYLFNFGRKNFNYFYHKKFERRNFWMGYGVMLVFFILVIISAIYLSI